MSRYLAEGKVAAGLALSHGPSVLVVALGCQPPGGPVLLAKRESDLSVSVRQFTTNRRNRDERGEEAVDSADERDFGEIIELIRSQGCGTLGGESGRLSPLTRLAGNTWLVLSSVIYFTVIYAAFPGHNCKVADERSND